MKIAIVLRGAVDNFDLFAKLWKNIEDLYPHIDFQYFIHTWTTTRKYVSGSIPIEELNIFTLDRTKIYSEHLKFFNPLAYTIGKDGELWKSSSEIYDTVKNDKVIKHIISQYNINLSDYRTQHLISGALEEDSEDPEMYELTSKLNIRRRLAQYFSAGYSAETLIDYHEKTGYVPDLVILTRPDCYIRHFNKNIFDRLHHKLTILETMRDPELQNPVLYLNGTCSHSLHWYCDYAYICKFDAFKYIFGSIPTNENIINAFTGPNLVSHWLKPTPIQDKIKHEDAWTHIFFSGKASLIHVGTENNMIDPIFHMRLIRSFQLDFLNSPEYTSASPIEQHNMIKGKCSSQLGRLLPDTKLNEWKDKQAIKKYIDIISNSG